MHGGSSSRVGRPQSVRLGSVDVKRINRERRDDLPPLSSESRAPSGQTQLPIQCRVGSEPDFQDGLERRLAEELHQGYGAFRRDHAVHDCVQYRWLDKSLFTSNRNPRLDLEDLGHSFSLVAPSACRPGGRLSDQKASPSCSQCGNSSYWVDAIRTAQQAREYLRATNLGKWGFREPPRRHFQSNKDFLSQFKPMKMYYSVFPPMRVTLSIEC
jgi:hypothetical protein